MTTQTSDSRLVLILELRLKGCQRNVEVWQRILKVRALVISPQEDQEMWIKFSNLCRKSGRYSTAKDILLNLMQITHGPTIADLSQFKQPLFFVIYAYLKLLWASNLKETTYEMLKTFTEQIQTDLSSRISIPKTATINAVYTSAASQLPSPSSNALGLDSKLLARCYVKLGQWELDISGSLQEVNIFSASCVSHGILMRVLYVDKHSRDIEKLPQCYSVRS